MLMIYVVTICNKLYVLCSNHLALWTISLPQCLLTQVVGGGEEVCLWRQGTAVCEDHLSAPNQLRHTLVRFRRCLWRRHCCALIVVETKTTTSIYYATVYNKVVHNNARKITVNSIYLRTFLPLFHYAKQIELPNQN